MENDKVDNVKELIIACVKGDLDRVKDLISRHGVSVDACSNHLKQTALMYACECGHTEVVRFLLEHKANAHLQDANYKTALIYACGCRGEYGREEILRFLLKYNANAHVQDVNYKTAPIYACGCNSGYDEHINNIAKHHQNQSPQTQTTLSNYKEIISLLLGYNVDVNIKQKNYARTALMFACMYRDGETVKLLLEHGATIYTSTNTNDIDYNYSTRRNALMYACRHNNLDAVKLLISKTSASNDCDLLVAKDAKGKSLLIHAILGRSLQIVKLVVGAGKDLVDVNECDNKGKTPLMYACSNSKGGEEEIAEIVELLLGKGSDVNKVEEKTGKTALIYASVYGYDRTVDLLITHSSADVNVNVNAADKKGMTALSHAAKNKHMKVVQRLTAPDVYDVDVVSETLLRASKDGSQVEIVQLLLFQFKDRINASVLTRVYFNAIRTGQIKSVKLMLVEFCIDVNTKDDNGKTGLMNACEKGQGKIVTLLLESGADPEVLNNDSDTALISSLLDKQLKCFEILVNYGVNLTTPQDYHILYYAIKRNSYRALTILAKSGRLVFNGRLSPTCYRDVQTNNHDINMSPILAHLMRIGLFDWAMCPADFKPEKLITQAISAGICPGKVKVYGGHFRSLLLLVCDQLPKNKSLLKLMIENLYFFPEDYSYLFKVKDTFRYKKHPNFLIEFLSMPPPTLVFWCFLAISKSVSLAGSPCLRVNRVKDLPIPRFWKNKLMFGNNNCFAI